jgi:hypothetical protein
MPWSTFGRFGRSGYSITCNERYLCRPEACKMMGGSCVVM